MKRKISEGKNAQKDQLPNSVALRGDVGQLNANWVENLMLWPTGWTSLEPLTDFYWDWNGSNWEPDIPRVVTGQKDRAKRLKAIGNGQVSLCAAVAWRLLNEN